MPIFGHTHPKIIETTFSFPKNANFTSKLQKHAKKTCTQIRIFHWFALEIRLIKNFCNLIGWEHFDPNFRSKKFPNWDMCWNTADNNINFCYKTNLVKLNYQLIRVFYKIRSIKICWLILFCFIFASCMSLVNLI